jgi:hypothetical protein
VLERDGLTVITARGGPRLHPCVAVENENRKAFAKLLRELDLDVATPAAPARPPTLRAFRGNKGA